MKTLKANARLVLAVIIGQCLLLTGCVTDTEDRIMDDARRFSAVTLNDPSFRPAAGDKLVWYSDLIVQDENAAIRATSEQISLVQSTMESQLIGKNYQFTDEPSEADYMIAAALVMDESTQSQQINDLVQIFPGIGGAFTDFDPGSLLVVISPPTDPRTAPLLWRGAIQVFMVGDALSPAMRMSRIQSMVTRLMNAVPEAGRRD